MPGSTGKPLKNLLVIGLILVAFIIGINVMVFYKQDEFIQPESTPIGNAGSPDKSLDLTLPEEEAGEDQQFDTLQQKLTLLLQPGSVYGYEGNMLENGQEVKYSQVRELVRTAKEKGYIILIKPEKDATYQNTVSILDEMSINEVPRYRVMDITEEEQQFLDQNNQTKHEAGY